jgi:hypothetical protein
MKTSKHRYKNISMRYIKLTQINVLRSSKHRPTLQHMFVVWTDWDEQKLAESVEEDYRGDDDEKEEEAEVREKEEKIQTIKEK